MALVGAVHKRRRFAPLCSPLHKANLNWIMKDRATPPQSNKFDVAQPARGHFCTPAKCG